jgi:hypothetical protein
MIEVLYFIGAVMAIEDQSYSHKDACVVYVPIILKVPLFVEPKVVAKKPDCQNGYKHYEEESAKVKV